ncbi:MAG: 16S rRNA (uracil(1498)-N(3))-methyltransferase [Crocinitomicaceae bacterium]|nr:16S rRNA (uracil(1498)-N(3))-methyltransferase [Crocinitomicaceae bacterium]
MRLFYDSHIELGAETHQLSEEESKHIVRVLRMNEGDQLAIVNGKGGYFETEISMAHPKRCAVSILKSEQSEPLEHELHIALGPTKLMDRIEWFVEKATEIGITEISFISGKNSERVKMKPERIQKKAISAMKQSKRRFLPKINSLVSVSEFIKEHPNGLIAHCEEGEKSTILDSFQVINCPILIGPEGDFTSDEISLALENGYKTITLGENRLRTETAALYACVCAQLKIDLS